MKSGEEGFGADLINKFLGIRFQIQEKNKYPKTRNNKNCQSGTTKDLEKRMIFLKKRPVVEEKLKKVWRIQHSKGKLKKQLNYEKDDNNINQLTLFLKSMITDLESG